MRPSEFLPAGWRISSPASRRRVAGDFPPDRLEDFFPDLSEEFCKDANHLYLPTIVYGIANVEINNI
jgi:hypothetical protein